MTAAIIMPENNDTMLRTRKIAGSDIRKSIREPKLQSEPPASTTTWQESLSRKVIWTNTAMVQNVHNASIMTASRVSGFILLVSFSHLPSRDSQQQCQKQVRRYKLEVLCPPPPASTANNGASGTAVSIAMTSRRLLLSHAALANEHAS